MRRFGQWIVAGGFALAPAAGAGAQTVYYGQNDAGTANAAITSANAAFLSALGGVGTESFESYAVGTASPVALGFAGAGTATLTGFGSIVNGNHAGAVAHTGNNYYLVITGTTGSEFAINFSNPVAAFGFYGSDIGDAGSNLLLRFGRANGSTYTTQVPYNVATGGLASGNLMFFGFIDTTNPFTSIQFLSTGAGDYFGFDDMTIGSRAQVINPPPSVAPEPATIALVGLGVVVVGAAARRRRAA